MFEALAIENDFQPLRGYFRNHFASKQIRSNLSMCAEKLHNSFLPRSPAYQKALIDNALTSKITLEI